MTLRIFTALTVLTTCSLASANAATDARMFRSDIQPLIERYCVSCHNEKKAKAKYRIDDIGGDIAGGDDIVRWEKAVEMIELGDMPPEDAKRQPTKAERAKLQSWIGGELKKIGRGKLEAALAHPEHGNRIDHDELFSGEHKGPAHSPPRLWRISQQIYSELISYDGSDATLEVVSGHGIKDYTSLTADEAAVKVVLQSAEVVASFMVGEKVSLKRKSPHGGHKSRLEHRPNGKLKAFVETEAPTDEQYTQATTEGFRSVFGRLPSDAEHTKFFGLLRDTSAEIGHRLGTKTMLKAMMLSPEMFYRSELGLGETLADGRRMLSPLELAHAIGFAILDSGPDAELMRAVDEGKLSTREDVEREVRRLLASKEDLRNRLYSMEHRWWEFKPKNGRLLRFFREYFGYHRATDVFKDETRKHGHLPRYLVRDADHLVLYAIERDERVLEFLLTTDRFFVAHDGLPERYFEQLAQRLAMDPEKQRFAKWVIEQQALGIEYPPFKKTGHIGAYGLVHRKWSYEPFQPFKQPVPRAGMLTHPAWLVAHSGNFDNDIVRRGKWIREHLLAGVVPELPIGVDAQISTDPTKTLREKMEMKVYNEQCWRCHKKMNPLGNAFEMYNDFGHYRTKHHIDHEGNLVGSPRELHNLRQKAAHKHNAGKPEYQTTTKPVITTGKLVGSGEPKLDGDVDNAIDLMHRLAKSDRVRQSFVRHAFRYWMGRNETLDDSPTLIAADRAYVDSDGSFTELLVSMLTSDSFLYRK